MGRWCCMYIHDEDHGGSQPEADDVREQGDLSEEEIAILEE